MADPRAWLNPIPQSLSPDWEIILNSLENFLAAPFFGSGAVLGSTAQPLKVQADSDDSVPHVLRFHYVTATNTIQMFFDTTLVTSWVV